MSLRLRDDYLISLDVLVATELMSFRRLRPLPIRLIADALLFLLEGARVMW